MTFNNLKVPLNRIDKKKLERRKVMKSWRKYFFSLVMFLTVFLVVACSSDSSSESSSSSDSEEEVKEIRFVAAQYSSNTQPFLEEVVSQFEEENHDIKVDLQVIGWDTLEQQVTTMVATDQTPDILNLNHYSEFAEDDLLMPLDEVISPELEEKLYDSFYEAGHLDGTPYGLPFLASIRGLYYNEEIFEKAGITEPPKTWSELIETAQTIKDRTGIDGFGVPMTTFEGQAYLSYFFWGNGGDWMKDGEWVINSKENVEALEFLSSLVNDYGITNPEPTAINRDELQKVFGAGQLGMMITANFFPTILANEFPDTKYGVSSIPVNEGVPEFNLGVQDFLMVFKSTEHPDAVSRFLDFLYEDERYEEFMAMEGMLPVTETAGQIMSEKDPLIAQFIEQLPIAKFYPLTEPAFPEIRLEIISAAQEVLLGNKTAQEALDEVQAIAEQQ